MMEKVRVKSRKTGIFLLKGKTTSCRKREKALYRGLLSDMIMDSCYLSLLLLDIDEEEARKVFLFCGSSLYSFILGARIRRPRKRVRLYL